MYTEDRGDDRAIVDLGFQLLREHVHQQPVMPRPVRPTLVVPHQSDRLEPNSLVSLDRAAVVSRRIDRYSVMAALVDQESSQGADRVGAEAFALPLRTQRDV